MCGALRSEGMLGNILQGVQLMFLRCIAGGVRKSTPRLLLLREFACKPLVRSWLRAAAVLWNRAVAGGEHSLLHQCMIENWSLQTDMRGGVKLWCREFEKVLQHIGYDTESLVCSVEGQDRLRCLNLNLVLSKFDSWFLQKWQDLPLNPRLAPSNQVLYSVYDRWFAPRAMSGIAESERYSICPAFVARTAGIPAAHVSALLRFRLGAHDLSVATGRWARDPHTGQPLARSQRLCRHCDVATVEDEYHMVFECSHYAAIRSRFSQLFQQFGGHASVSPAVVPDGMSMVQFMSQHKRLVAAFVYACWLSRCSNVMQQLGGLELQQVFESDVEIDSDDILHVSIGSLLNPDGTLEQGAANEV